MKFSLFILFVWSIGFIGCHRDEMTMQKLDLEQYGLPITILAPDSAEVQLKDYNFIRDITVRKGDHFFLQIFEYDVTNIDVAGEKLRQLTSVKKDPFFKEVIEEEDNGFIYSKFLDSTQVDYDFRLVKILADKELIFQTGLVGSFSLEDVTRMYKAVKAKN